MSPPTVAVCRSGRPYTDSFYVTAPSPMGERQGHFFFANLDCPHPTTMIRLVHCGIAARIRREGRLAAAVVRGLAILGAPAPSPARFHRTHSCEISRTSISINPHDLTCLAVGRDEPPLSVAWPSWERRRPRRHGFTGRTRVRFPARHSRYNTHDLTCLAVGRDGPPLSEAWPSWERRRPRRHGFTGRTRVRFPARHSRYNTHDLTCLAVGRDEPTDGRSVPEWAALYGQFLCHRPVSHGG